MKGATQALENYKQWWMKSRLLPNCARDEKTFYERFAIKELSENGTPILKS